MKTCVLGIDYQKDFCNGPNESYQGTLYVPGAYEDAERFRDMVKQHGDKIQAIYLTMDSHYLYHIANPLYWRNSNGDHPAPFTLITNDDVVNGKWMPTRPSEYDHAKFYTESLAKNGKYVLVIWPPHCIVGNSGHTLAEPVYDAVKEWEEKHITIAARVTKGSNYRTEHYSIFAADVPDPSDPTTSLNIGLVNVLQSFDRVLICGEALSHCVANSSLDLFANFKAALNKVYLLQDLTSNVPGFENLGNDFLAKTKSMGVNVTTSTEFWK